MLLLFFEPVLEQNLHRTNRRHTESVSLIAGEDPWRVMGHKDMVTNGAHGGLMEAGPLEDWRELVHWGIYVQ